MAFHPNTVTPVSLSMWTAMLDVLGRSIERDRLAKNFGAGSYAHCLRETGYQMLQMLPTDKSYKWEWDLAKAEGIGAHERVQDVLAHGEAEGVPFTLVGSEIWCAREDLRFGGFIDAVVDFHQGVPALEVRPGLCVVECKSVASKYLARGNRYYQGKLDDYVAQALAYLALYEAPDGRKAQQALIYVFSRDDAADARVYKISPDREFIDTHIEERIAPAAYAVSTGELPAAEPGDDCRFCGYRSICGAAVGGMR